MITYGLPVPVLTTLLAILGVVIAFGVVLIPMLRARREAARIDAASRALLAKAAATLGLSQPRRVKGLFVIYACAGKMRGIEAELGVYGPFGQVSLSLIVEGLHPDIKVMARPTGRAREDFYLGVAVDSGYALFDTHYCIYGSALTGEALRVAARAVPRDLLDYVAGHFEPAYAVTLSRSELVVRPVSDPADSPADKPPTDLIALWRFADRLVTQGLDRGLIGPLPHQ